ncbi:MULTISPECIES: response regulator transcription factor [unclassified Trinickia]|uniref:response regulator transcription factor n=1 Tax=unclassified Trinickia TaxID=2638168 RepID=UPI0024057960|nr:MULTISPECIES: response regulator transcription factor [unclassified Trinickia]MDG0022744.1 response regulator transcription factor [Trinickia sp. Y13]HVW50997.1 response regulator transcription factor [Trinickia sp.]
MNKPLQIILAEDHGIVRYGMRLAIEAGHVAHVIAEAANSDELIAAVRQYPCDAIVTDLSMPGTRTRDGIALVDRLQRICPGVPIIVVTALRNAAILNKLLAKGVKGVVEKAGGVNELHCALVAAGQGRTYVSPGVEKLLARMNLVGERVGREATLTTAEMEVIRLFAADGLTAAQIAERLNRSVKTVSAHKVRAQHKLGVGTNQELLEYWRAHNNLCS